MSLKRISCLASILVVSVLFLTHDIAADGGYGDRDYVEGQDLPMDEVILDDLIVEGSACVGFDCTSDMNFDYDTIVLQENNLRIFFNDTSSAYFPDNDWRITVNDILHEGNDFFAIDDATGQTRPFTITAGAPDNALNIDSNGYVGLGTSAPDVKLHVSNGDIKLDDNEWVYLGSDSPSDARIGHSSTTQSLNIVSGFGEAGHSIRLGLGYGTTWKPWLVIDPSGNVGMGTTYPGYPLDMKSGAHCTAGGVWTNASSRDYKEHIRNLSKEEAMDALSGLKPVTFNYKNEADSDSYVGFIAEDVPDLVASSDRKGLSPMDITAVLTKVVQEQQAIINELSGRISKLEKQGNADR